MSREHAEHNESVSDYLFKAGKYSDWVITTTFYAALHYVQSELFPLADDSDDSYDTFEDYFASISNNPNNKLTKHTATIYLANDYLPAEAADKYRWLYSKCMTTRYKKYNVLPAEAMKARRYLKDIKECLKK